MRKAILLLAVAGLSACTLGPDYERPTMDLPDSALDATLLSKTQQDAMAYWWTRYRDPVLNELIDDALDDNLDVALQAARFREARAQLGLANANLFPSIQGQAQAAREKTSYLGASSGGSGGAGGGASSGSGSTQAAGQRYNYFSVAATLSYELDVFGGLRRASEQARAQLLSSAYTQDSIRLGVVSDVVTNYMSLRALERQIRVTQETIKTRQKGLELDQQRYKYGAIDKLTLLQTRSLLETAQAQLPPLQQQASELRSSLAVLTGHTPREIMAGSNVEPGSFEDVHLPEDLPVVMPSLLVERRPDIRAAEASLIAANASIGVATVEEPDLASQMDDTAITLEGAPERPKRGPDGRLLPVLTLPGDTLDDTQPMAGLTAASTVLAVGVIGRAFAASGGVPALVGVALGGVAGELFSGTFHWATDNYGRLETPVVGFACAAFQGHHLAPWTISHRSFPNNVYKIAAATLPLSIVLGWLLTYGFERPMSRAIRRCVSAPAATRQAGV